MLIRTRSGPRENNSLKVLSILETSNEPSAAAQESTFLNFLVRLARWSTIQIRGFGALHGDEFGWPALPNILRSHHFQILVHTLLILDTLLKFLTDHPLKNATHWIKREMEILLTVLEIMSFCQQFSSSTKDVMEPVFPVNRIRKVSDCHVLQTKVLDYCAFI